MAKALKISGGRKMAEKTERRLASELKIERETKCWQASYQRLTEKKNESAKAAAWRGISERHGGSCFSGNGGGGVVAAA